ncbi:MAG: hypothetical protein Q6373_025175 [Candidatus Sigynarchaeota archaeon]
MKQKNKNAKVLPDEVEIDSDHEDEKPVDASLDTFAVVDKDAIIGSSEHGSSSPASDNILEA